jgi:WD40 repeat protein
MPMHNRNCRIGAVLSFLHFFWLVGVAAGQTSKDLPRDTQTSPPPARTDIYGDPLPPGATARFGTMSLRSDYREIAFCSDGREFYTWKWDGLLRVHDAADGKALRAFLLPDPTVGPVQFSASGRFLTKGIDSAPGYSRATALTIWETTSGKLSRRIEAARGETFYPWDASMHDDRTVITCELESGAVRVWDVETGASRLLRESSKGVIRFAPSPDGKRLFVQLDGTIQCWDLTNGTERWRYAYAGNRQELMVSPDGISVLIEESKVGGSNLELLDAATGKPRPDFKLPEQYAGLVRWGVDGRTLLVPHWDDKILRVWDVDKGKELIRLPCDHWATAIAPDGKSVVGSDGGLQRWDLKSGKPMYAKAADRGHTGRLLSLASSSDGKLLVSVDMHGSVWFWDVRAGRPIRVLRDAHCRSMAFTLDGSRLVLGIKGEGFLICDPASGKVHHRVKLEGLDEDFLGLKYPSMRLAGNDIVILSRDISALSVRAWSVGPGSVTAAWDLDTGKRLWRHSADGTEGLTGLSQDGRFGVAWDLTIREPENGRLIGPLQRDKPGGQSANHATRFSPDASLIATLASHSYKERPAEDWEDCGIEIWERATRRPVRRLPIRGSFVFATDGRRIAVRWYGEFWIWDLMRGKELLHVKSPPDLAHWRAERMAFAPTGRALAMSTEDGSILLFDVPVARPEKLAALTDAQLRQAWADLGDEDPAKAYSAVADLADRPDQAVSFLKERLRPVPATPVDQVRRIVADLDSEVFETREDSERRLAELGAGALPTLREALTKEPSVESRRRLERLLDDRRPPAKEVLRSLRAVRVLELAGTAPAREFLKAITSSDRAAELTREANAAVQRLERMATK